MSLSSKCVGLFLLIFVLFGSGVGTGDRESISAEGSDGGTVTSGSKVYGNNMSTDV